MMKIIALCGMPGSGKGEIADRARNRGIHVHSMGDVVREHFSLNCPDRDPIETGMHADMARKKYGDDIWAKRLIGTVERGMTPDMETVIIDGLRSSREAELFKGRWEDRFRIIAVHSSPTTRFERLLVRGRGDDPASRKKFDERDERELRWGLGDVIARADEMIVNETCLETFKQRIDAFLDGLGDFP